MHVICKYSNKYVYLLHKNKHVMRTSNYTDFRKNLKKHLDTVISDNDALVINRSDNSAVVVISLEEYNSIMETEYIMASPETVADIERSRQEIKEGKGIEVDIDAL